MSRERNVFIEIVKGTTSEYVIKDKNKITIGRFTILDLDKENKRCNIRFKFYRQGDYDLMSEAIDFILRVVYKNGVVHKVNFYTSENTELAPFLGIGFNLEGILTDNLWINGEFINEIVLGINKSEYNSQYLTNNVVSLESDRLYIRNLTPDDAEELLDYYKRNEKHLKQFEPSRDLDFYTLEVQKSILTDSYSQLIKGTCFDLGIFIDDNLVGKVKISNIVYGVFKNAFIGYSIDESYQGKGYMNEAVNLVLEFAQDELGLHRIEASVLVENTKSISVLDKCGFKQIGLNERYLFINNKWRDHYTYYRLLDGNK